MERNTRFAKREFRVFIPLSPLQFGMGRLSRRSKASSTALKAASAARWARRHANHADPAPGAVSPSAGQMIVSEDKVESPRLPLVKGKDYIVFGARKRGTSSSSGRSRAFAPSLSSLANACGRTNRKPAVRCTDIDDSCSL